MGARIRGHEPQGHPAAGGRRPGQHVPPLQRKARAGSRRHPAYVRRDARDGRPHLRLARLRVRAHLALPAARARCAAGLPGGAADDGPGRHRERRTALPVDETIGWLRGRLAEIVQEGLDRDEFTHALVPDDIAATIVATVQGGYVLARAAGSTDAFDAAVRGLLTLLAPAADAG